MWVVLAIWRTASGVVAVAAILLASGCSNLAVVSRVIFPRK